MKSYSKPTSEQLDAAMPLLSSPPHEAYFFSRLNNPHWIPALRTRNVFAYPPAAQRVDGGGMRYPSWPPSGYLVRMASLAPAEVADIYSHLQTDNATIVGNMLDAAMAMPADVAVKLVPNICRAAQDGLLWRHFRDASDLCVKLANNGETDAAIMLADAIFTPRPEDAGKDSIHREVYWFKEGLKKVVPLLSKQRAGDFAPRLCDWLKTAVEAKVLQDPEFDYSYIWRPAIEEHEQNRDHDLAGVLAGSVREGLECAITDGGMSLDEVLEIVSRYPYQVFKRMRLHLINTFAEQNSQLARKVMMDHDLFEDFRCKHEYAMLVGQRLQLLTPEERDTWFGWVDAGPDMSGFDDSIKRNLQRGATDVDRQNRIRYWRFVKLHWVRKHLESARRDLYEEMLTEHGEPEMADLAFRVGNGRYGSDSPMTVADLAAMTFEEAVDRVASWRPDKPGPMGRDIEGLASVFGQYVAGDPDAFSQRAGALTGRPAIYVRRFISGMTEALKAGRNVDVAAILGLCHWVVKQPLDERTTPTEENEGLVDKDWQWTRDEISRFVEEICKAKTGEAPRYPMRGLREEIWGIITVLSQGPASSYVVHDIEKDDPRLRDYLDVGINSPRGKAVEAALEYARWIANHIKEIKGAEELVPGGFQAMPEVRESLQWHLAPENRTFQAMSIIGSRAGLIYWIDREWLAQATDSLFNLDGIEQTPPLAHGWAAWNSFLVWVRPHIEFYKLFRKQFEYSVKQAARVEVTGNEPREQPMFHLGEHLVVLYGRGDLSLDGDGALLRRLFTESAPCVRRHVIGFVGQSLDGGKEIPTDVAQRFMALWEFYWATRGKDDTREQPGAWLFGRWFSCGKFLEGWSLSQLEEFVAVDPTPEPDHAIAERLAEIAHCDIMKAVSILDRMIRGDAEGWRIHGWLDSARRILEIAMRAGGQARLTATELINYLGRRGHTAFGELLKL